jgi:all-trans-nonaprenyl-diphosphate synthase
MSVTKTASIQQFYEPVQSQLQGVKESLLAIVPPESQLLAETLHLSLNSGGKLLRPVICLLVGRATSENFNAVQSQALIEVSAVSEMIHIATLLHDDVLDEADFRRNKKTVRALWGNTVSVLSGDYLLAQASRKLAQVGNIRLVAIYSDVLADLCDGEVEQIRTSYQLNTPWDSYFRKTICKTASLFSAACESAGVVNELDEADIQSLKAFGRDFGIAFQIMDDLLDYTSSAEEMGKPVLDDLRNGLVTAPVLLALESEAIPEAEKQQIHHTIQAIFALSDETQEAEQRALALSLKETLIRFGMIEATLQLAHQYAEQATGHLKFVPDGIEKQALIGILMSSLNRKS